MADEFAESTMARRVGGRPAASGHHTGHLEEERIKRAFLAHMRDELCMPINAILGYSELLLDDAVERGHQAFVADIEKIHVAGAQLQTLVSQILDQRRIEAQVSLDIQAFSAHIRHALRTPITAVVGYCEMLLEDIEKEHADDLAPDLRKIRAAGGRLLALISDILTLWQVEAGRAELDLEGAETSGMIQELVRSIRPLVEGSGAANAVGSLLVADGNETNSELLRRRLERYGHTVATVGNGREALERIRSGGFDLVLLSIMLPEMNGYQVLAHIKTDESLRHVPVIMISALDEMDSVVRCIEMGAEDYLPKPCNPVLLRARIDACLDKKRLRDQEARLYAELQGNYQRLQELESLRDSLTHMVIHDLRTPLTSLLSGLEMLEAGGDLNDDQDQILAIATRGGRTLLGMINDLLDISKMESGTLTLEYRETAPAELIDRVVSQVAHLAAGKQIIIQSDAPSHLPVLQADEEKLLRTLANLVGNAVKFTPPRGTITITARLQENGTGLLFSVTDTGEGIPKEAFGRIFEKFGQVETRKAGRKMSTGLGLTFCKMVVEAHGGTIRVESKLGQGSTFLFTIPFAADCRE